MQSLFDILWGYRAYSQQRDVQTSRKARFLFRSVLYYKASATWFNFVKTRHLATHSAELKELLQQPHRPLYDYRLSAEQRTALLISHHESAMALLGNELAQRLLRHEAIPICEISSKHGDKYRICLVTEGRLSKEGQLSLRLSDEHETLISIAFSLSTLNQKTKIIIGAIQATHNEALSKIRHATHAFHGIQPRLLLVSALRLLATQLGVEVIEAISTKNHVYQSLRYRHKKSISSSYDSLWEMVLGEKMICGNYEIPLAPARKLLETYPSKKRAEYKQRFQLIDSIEAQISSFFAPALNSGGG